MFALKILNSLLQGIKSELSCPWEENEVGWNSKNKTKEENFKLILGLIIIETSIFFWAVIKSCSGLHFISDSPVILHDIFFKYLKAFCTYIVL